MSQRPQDTVIAGMVWFTRENFSKCLAIFDDPDQYPDTFDKWLADAKRLEKVFQLNGAKVVRAIIDPDTFPAWCAANGFTKINAKARSHFANLKAAESVGVKPVE